jgi:hypothetical protein
VKEAVIDYDKLILEWGWAQGITLTRYHNLLTVPAVPGTARYCQLHLQHRPHIASVVPWFLLPEKETDLRFMWVCMTGYANLSQAVQDVRVGRRWTHYYSPSEKALAVYYKRYIDSPVSYPLEELDKIPW